LEYQLGDTVNIKFDVVGVEHPLARIVGASVSLFTDEGQTIKDATVKIVDNTVEFSVPQEMTKNSGDYAAYFKFTFKGGQARTHKVPFTILPRNNEED